MAKSSTRRVTIYINGKEVEASVKQIRSEMNNLVNEQNRMVIGLYTPFQRAVLSRRPRFVLRGTRLPRRDDACVGPMPTDMQRLTALGAGTKNREQRKETKELGTVNRKSPTANRKNHYLCPRNEPFPYI